MPQRSKSLHFHDDAKLKATNQESRRLWDKYVMDMELRDLSPKTIAGYQNDMEHLLIYCYDHWENKSVLDFTEDDLTEFLLYCKKEGNNTQRIKRRMASISAFYKFLRKKKLIAENPSEFLDRPKRAQEIVKQTFLTQEQIDEIRAYLDSCVGNAKKRHEKDLALTMRLYAMFSLSTMARVNAIRNVRWEQVDFNERTVNDVVEKEGYIVTLYFSETVRDLMREVQKYRKENGIDDGGFLFYSITDGKPGAIGATSLNLWCKKIGSAIGVPTLHPHDWRHSASQLAKLRGCPLEDISAMLNHSGTDVTKKFYLRDDRKQIQATRDKFGI